MAEALEELVSRTALGDRQAFARLYQASSPKLFGVCLRLLRDRSEAEDILQEVYIKVWHNAGRYQATGHSPMGWLVAISRNACIDRIRARRAPAVELDEANEIQDEGPGPEAQLVTAGEGRRIDLCLDKLPAERAQAVRAAYVEGYSYQELADRFSLPINTLRTWLRRSLISLRECLEQ